MTQARAITLLDRIHGALAGLALGDAVGMPTEFMLPEAIRAVYGWVDRPLAPLKTHFHHELPAGHITDDTGQALALCRAYLTPEGLTPETTARELLAWADGEPHSKHFLGPSTARALERLRMGEDPRHSGRDGATNGAAMRAPVIGLFHPGKPDDCLDDVEKMCLPTHGTGPAISGAAAVACAVAAAMKEDATLEDILGAARKGARAGSQRGAWGWSTPLQKRIALAVQLVQENANERAALQALSDYVGVGLPPSESVASALGALVLANGDAFGAICYCANLGGDTDSMAAIAGAIGGAWLGIGALPAEMVFTVEQVNQLNLAQFAARLCSKISASINS